MYGVCVNVHEERNEHWRYWWVLEACAFGGVGWGRGLGGLWGGGRGVEGVEGGI